MPASRSPRRYLSPLRYPGGKARMFPLLADMLDYQTGFMDVEVWVEPFGGGLGAGLALLDTDQVAQVWFAEANPALAALWRALITDTTRMAGLVAGVRPTLDVFEDARATVANPDPALPDEELGLAALILNRCSRSGIIAPNVGPVGGKHQSGKWTVASRFDPERLAGRISDIAPLLSRCIWLGADGITAIEELDGTAGVEDEVVIFTDPPYIKEGNRLYTNGMTADQHQRLAAALHATPARWLLTYDDHPDVRRLYPKHRIGAYDWQQTANTVRADDEVMVLSDNLEVPMLAGGRITAA